MAVKRSTTRRTPTRTSRDERRPASKSVVPLDLSEVEGRTGRKQGHYKEGDYLVKIKKAEYGKSGQKQTKQIVVQHIFTDGKYKGKPIYDRHNLLPQSLWTLRNLLEAVEMKIPKGRFNLDLKKLVGRELAITVSDDEYEGKVSSRVTDWFPASEFEADVMEDEEEEFDEEEEEEEEGDEDFDEDEEEEEEEEEDEDEDEIEGVDLDDI
jgi:Protein of unknown function (DUF669)